jgi:hypothetical protein
MASGFNLNDLKKRDLAVSSENLAELEHKVYAEIFKLESQKKFRKKIRISVISSAAAAITVILTTLFFQNYISTGTSANADLIFANNSMSWDMEYSDIDEAYLEDYIDDIYEYYY